MTTGEFARPANSHRSVRSKDNSWNIKISKNGDSIDAGNLLAALDSIHPNGGAKFVSTCYSGSTEFLNLLSQVDSRSGQDAQFALIEALISSDEIVNSGLPVENESAFRPKFISPYEIDGLLASHIMNGGAYRRFSGRGWQAKTLAVEFCRSLFWNRYEDILAYQFFGAWSDWFYGIAWDGTWIFVDRNLQVASVLVVTDSD